MNHFEMGDIVLDKSTLTGGTSFVHDKTVRTNRYLCIGIDEYTGDYDSEVDGDFNDFLWDSSYILDSANELLTDIFRGCL